jgi:cell division protein FtsZ
MVTGMSDEFTTFAQRARIKVCGVGGGGSNAVNRMISAGLQDVDFIVINTDAQALKNSPAPRRLQIGLEVTGGLGSGGKPEIGRKSALEDQERLTEALRGADMVFLTAGMGGGTGTGAAPVVAEIARATGALTLGIVTLPFSFEGKFRSENAASGLTELEQQVNSLIVIPNDRVAALGRNSITFLNAFEQADEVLHNGVRAITQLIQVHGLWNVDFADFRTVMDGGGRALMGIGRAQGERRAVCAAEEAIVCPLLEQSSINGATGVIVNIRGGRDIGMREVEEAVTVVKEAAHPQATLFVGAALDDEEHPELEVTVIAAGFSADTASDAFADVFRKQEHYSFNIEPEQNPAPAYHSQVAPEPREESVPEPPVRVHPDGQIDLLPEDESAKKSDAPPPTKEPEPAPYKEDEDIAIPTWFRKRRKF